MSTGYHNSNRSRSGGGFEIIGMGFGVLLCLVTGLPALIVGLISQRLISRYSWSFYFWMIMLVLSFAALAWLYLHGGLKDLLIEQLAAFFIAFNQHQLDYARWPWRDLWNLTWPVWIYSLVAAPLYAAWREGSEWARGYPGNTAKRLAQEERKRQRRHEKHQQKARKKTSKKRIPDETGQMMVMGVPIKDQEN